MCSSCPGLVNGSQALFGLAVIASGNHNKVYIKLAWSTAIRCPNGSLETRGWRGAVFSPERPARCNVADKDIILCKVPREKEEKKKALGKAQARRCASGSHPLLVPFSL